ELLQAAKNGHRQARESITSITARIRIKTVNTGEDGRTITVENKGEWFQAGSSVRWKETLVQDASPVNLKKPEDIQKQLKVEVATEGAIVDGLVTCISSREQADGLRSKGAVIAVSNGTEAGFIDLWSRAVFLVQDKPRESFLDVIENNDWVKNVEAVNLPD